MAESSEPALFPPFNLGPFQLSHRVQPQSVQKWMKKERLLAPAAINALCIQDAKVDAGERTYVKEKSNIGLGVHKGEIKEGAGQMRAENSIVTNVTLSKARGAFTSIVDRLRTRHAYQIRPYFNTTRLPSNTTTSQLQQHHRGDRSTNQIRPLKISSAAMAKQLGTTGEFFRRRDEWRKHPMLTKQFRHSVPGLGIALVAFGVYLIGEAAYNKFKSPYSPPSSASSSHNH
ncbi:hypothetical protein Droror1_Dr00001293 [Drosera rotundifolia]